jgi:aminopeptidase N
VNYDEDTWERISGAYPTLSTVTRSQLMDDALNLARAGRLAYDTALKLTRQLASETALVPLGSAKTAIREEWCCQMDENYGG